MNEPLQKTLTDAADFLKVENVPFAVIDGIAVAYRGEPRTTADVDLVIGIDVDRAIELLAGLNGTRFEPLFDRADEVVRRSFILPLRHRETGIRLDLAIGLSGFERQVIERATDIDLPGCIIPAATAEDLLLMKLLAGRPRDDGDIRGIVVVQGEDLDWDYCLGVARDLGTALDVDLAAPIERLRNELGRAG